MRPQATRPAGSEGCPDPEEEQAAAVALAGTKARQGAGWDPICVCIWWVGGWSIKAAQSVTSDTGVTQACICSQKALLITHSPGIEASQS